MKTVNNTRFRLVALAVAFSVATLLPLTAQQTSQRTYDSPAKAAAALFDAAMKNDVNELKQILGPEADAILTSGDPVADRGEREKVVEKYGQMRRFVTEPNNMVTLYIGAENWPFPIPLAQKNGAWSFDTAKGKEEILARRIGRNEAFTIDTMQSLTDAQKEYAARIHWKTDTSEYAPKFMSDEGKQNGLYWKTAEGQPQSPIGPLVAEAARRGYKSGDSTGPTPFHGYAYRILQRQGKHAPNGAMNYMVNGKMTRGFAFVAYPADYRNSGVMTFIVGKDGKVYQKDLGPNTAHIASSMTTFDPDKTWTAAQ